MMSIKKISYLFLIALVITFIVILEEERSITGELILDSQVGLSTFLEYGELNPGETQIVSTKIINRGEEELQDILIKYNLLDLNKENELFEHSESVALQTTLSLVRKIHIPENLESGKYTIEVLVQHKEGESKTSSTFIVRSLEYPEPRFEHLFTVLVVLLVGIALYLLHLARKVSKHEKKISKVR